MIFTSQNEGIRRYHTLSNDVQALPCKVLTGLAFFLEFFVGGGGGGGGQNILLSEFILLCYCFRAKFQKEASLRGGGGETATEGTPIEESQLAKGLKPNVEGACLPKSTNSWTPC